jgi:PucR C-terminal helix-turn-helix domain
LSQANNVGIEPAAGTVDAELRAALLPTVPVIVDAAIAAIRGLPGAADISDEALERNLRIGLTDAVDRWFAPADFSPQVPDLHFALGRAQARSGRSLDELMGFYRIAGQTMWRRLTELGTSNGASPDDLYRLAESGFGTVDELSTQAAAGFADEQSQRLGAAHSLRSEFVRLLLRDPQPAPGVLLAAAGRAHIELSSTLALFVGPGERYEAFARLTRDHAVLGPREGEFVGVLFDPDGPGRRGVLARAAERCGAQLALGPSVDVAEARASLARARALLALLADGLVQAEPLADCARHDVELLLSSEPRLAGEVARRRLAPLLEVRGETTRQNLLATLRAWLARPGQRKAVAHELGVHPQTVRYRMARLRELFGGALDEPDGRFELELALRVRAYAGLGAEARPEASGAPAEAGGD